MPLITNLSFRKVLNYILPPISERMRTAFQTLDFAAQSEYIFDLAYSGNEGSKMVVQSVTIDNTANDQHVIMASDKSLTYTRRIEAGELRVVNIPAVDPSYLVFTSTGTGTCRVYMNNYPSLPDSQYENQAAALLAAAGAVLPATFSSANGAVNAVSAQVVPANAARKRLTIQNTHAAQTLYISFTNPATVNDIALIPGASETFQNPAPSNALYGIGGGAATTFAYHEA